MKGKNLDRRQAVVIGVGMSLRNGGAEKNAERRKDALEYTG